MNKKHFFYSILFALVAPFLMGEGHNFLSLSLGDLYAVGKGPERLNSPEKIERALTVWKDMYDCDSVLWRIEDPHLDYYDMSTRGYIGWHVKQLREMRSKFNENKVGREVCTKLGLKFYLNVSYLDGWWPPKPDGFKVYYAGQDRTLKEHPEYQEIDCNGTYHWGVWDISQPAVRKILIDRIIKYVNEMQADGIYLNSRTHSGVYSKDKNYKPGPHHADRFGFGAEIVKEYKKRYGIDILKDARFHCKSPSFAPKSQEVENWRRLKGEFFYIFYKEVKAALGEKKLILCLPKADYMGSEIGNVYVDHARIISEKMADMMAVGLSSGYVPKKKHRSLGYLSSEAHEDNFNTRTIQEYLKQFGKLAADNGVKIYDVQRSAYTPAMRQGALHTPYLTGMMIYHLSLAPMTMMQDVAALRPAQGIFTVEATINLIKDKRMGDLLSKYNHLVKADAGRGWSLGCAYRDFKKENDVCAVFRAFIDYQENGKKMTKDVHLFAEHSIAFQQWSHITGCLDMNKSTMTIYVNGKQEGMIQLPKGATLHQNVGTEFVIGAYAGSYTEPYSGGLAQVRLSNTMPVTKEGIPQYSGKEPGTIFYCDYNRSLAPIVLPAGCQFRRQGIFETTAGPTGGKALKFPGFED